MNGYYQSKNKPINYQEGGGGGAYVNLPTNNAQSALQAS